MNEVVVGKYLITHKIVMILVSRDSYSVDIVVIIPSACLSATNKSTLAYLEMFDSGKSSTWKP